MLKMMAGQIGTNNPIGKFIENASEESLKNLVSKLKYLLPVVKYGFKSFKFVKNNKSTFIILLVAFFVKYFFFWSTHSWRKETHQK